MNLGELFSMNHHQKKFNLVTILGPTASGKTGIAANLAAGIGGEVISGDSRQVYRRMNLGTGKDYDDYRVNGIPVPYHLIDIADPGEHYNVFRFRQDFLRVFSEIAARGHFPVLCGGSGLYIEAVLNDYQLIQVPPDHELRQALETRNLDELTEILKDLKPSLHNITDIVNTRRAIRAIEIEKYYLSHPPGETRQPEIFSLNIGIRYEVNTRRNRISERLERRLSDGMIEEVEKLLVSGLKPEDLIYYGLEYKYLTLYITGAITRKQLHEQLEIAIHQFAKRQMTWFRGMERRGTDIHWIDGTLPMEEKIAFIMELLA